jgi:RNA polymerase sigma-70 factor, ECF subfamily
MEHNITESQLLEKVRDSEMQAFRVLFEKYQPIIFRYAIFYTRRTEIARDIAQETFVHVWDHRSSLKPHLSFLAYVLRISGNLIRDYVKHVKVRERLVDALPYPSLSEGDDPEEALHLRILEEKIDAIIKTALPQRCRDVFLLSRLEGKSNKEIAEIFRVSVRTIEHQISYALKILRKRIDVHHDRS